MLSLIAVAPALQALIVADIISRYVVPPPSDVVVAIGRALSREHVVARFLLTSGETFAAGLLILAVGVPIGFWLHRSRVGARAFEPWVAAWAAAPLVLAYPLFLVLFGRSSLTIMVLGFAAGVAPVILKTLEGLMATRPRADRCRPIAADHVRADVPQDPVSGGNAGDLHRACASG